MKNNLEIINNIDLGSVSQMISEKLLSLLAEHDRILFLVPGGSAAPVANLALSRLSAENLSRISVMLTDERYGEPGHPESNGNYYQKIENISFTSVLDGSELAETVSRYEKNLEREFSQTNYRLGLFGIGADGHTAGIMPQSPAIKSERLAESQLTPAFLRITITPLAIFQLDEAFIFAVGSSKWPVVSDLLSRDLDITTEPAQILTKLKKLTIFSDFQNN